MSTDHSVIPGILLPEATRSPIVHYLPSPQSPVWSPVSDVVSLAMDARTARLRYPTECPRLARNKTYGIGSDDRGKWETAETWKWWGAGEDRQVRRGTQSQGRVCPKDLGPQALGQTLDAGRAGEICLPFVLGSDYRGCMVTLACWESHRIQ